MNDNTRVIIVQPCERWPDGYVPVENCGCCDFCGRMVIDANDKQKDIHACKRLVHKDLNNFPEFHHSKIVEMRKILPDCPLPLLSRVKKHSPDEKPEICKTVNLYLKEKSQITGKEREIARTGEKTHNGSWIIHGYGLLDNYKNFKLISWQELPQ